MGGRVKLRETRPSSRDRENVLAASASDVKPLSQALSTLARHPKQTRALQVVAIAHAQTGDRSATRAVFQKLIEIEPDAWLHFNNFAQLEMESNNFEGAAGLFKRASPMLKVLRVIQ